MKKLCGHLWYLSVQPIASAFFDRDIDASEKRLMIERLDSNGAHDAPKKISLDQSEIGQKRLCDFVTTNTRKVFVILSLSQSFLLIDPETWITNTDYIQAEEIV